MNCVSRSCKVSINFSKFFWWILGWNYEKSIFPTSQLSILDWLPWLFCSQKARPVSWLFVSASGFHSPEASRKLKQTGPEEVCYRMREKLILIFFRVIPKISFKGLFSGLIWRCTYVMPSSLSCSVIFHMRWQGGVLLKGLFGALHGSQPGSTHAEVPWLVACTNVVARLC
jgi:hypothetical protein